MWSPRQRAATSGSPYRMAVPATPKALAAHLLAYLGTWPPSGQVAVVGSPARLAPAWDGSAVTAVAVTSPAGTVVSVPPEVAAELNGAVARPDDPSFGERLARAVGSPGRASPWLVLRWTVEPADLPPAGQWVDAGDPRLPAWLRPFPSPVLAAFDEDGDYVAGAGLKHHTEWGREVAVGTIEGARGQGLARRLVAQMASGVLDGGGIPLYVHHPANEPSARVADAAGFADQGWRLLIVAPDGPR